ncbi:spermidine synthase [Microbulbifer sp. SA54]|uniref:spermidine synthase n=1 Tax=Microbulbifer sp. SA54 TaxID=3401577 RepID=UPI003AAC6FAC
MALIWQKDTAGSRYEVRTHGASVRLYSNGVFHSQWNPRDPLKGSLWELLLLPAFFVPTREVRRVLVLGVGGGAVIRLLQRFLAPDEIVGVDIDRTHLQVARRFFGVRGARLECADARAFVGEQLRLGESGCFDLIIDDLFGHAGGIAARAIDSDVAWSKQLLALLAPAGVLVSNFASRGELLKSGWRDDSVRQHLSGCWTAEHPAYNNCIGVFSRQALSRRNLTAQAPPELNPLNPRRRLDSRLRPLR